MTITVVWRVDGIADWFCHCEENRASLRQIRHALVQGMFGIQDSQKRKELS